MWPILALVLCSVLCEAEGARYSFFRRLSKSGRRVFGGGESVAGEWPAACALLDRALEARCSCSVLAPRWALTAAHCAVPAVVYVQYNGPERAKSNVVAVGLIYSHPGFTAEEKDLGAGMDVVTLRHDIGLVRTRGNMVLATGYFSLPAVRSSEADPLTANPLYDMKNLIGKNIDILGYGMTEKKPVGEELRAVQLRLVSCERPGWEHCVCALGSARGVCAGDSGGPVLYNGTQIGVTSMGPIECGSPQRSQDVAMSVFTELVPYVELVENTMRDVDSVLKMRVVPQHESSRVGRKRLGAQVALIALMLCRIF